MSHYRFMVVLSIAGLLGAATARAGDAYTYDLVDYPADQSGWTLSGWITVDQLGPITTADITDFTWTVSQAGQPSYTLTLGTSEVYVGGSALNATTTELTFDTTVLDCVLRLGNTNDYLRYASGLNDVGIITAPAYQASGDAWYWSINGPAMNESDRWVIAAGRRFFMGAVAFARSVDAGRSVDHFIFVENQNIGSLPGGGRVGERIGRYAGGMDEPAGQSKPQRRRPLAWLIRPADINDALPPSKASAIGAGTFTRVSARLAQRFKDTGG